MKPAALPVFFFLLLSACSSPETAPAVTATPTPSPPPTLTPTLLPELQAYLENALAMVEDKSIYSASTDWESVRALAFQAAAQAQTPADLYPVLNIILTLTGDRHGYVMPPIDIQEYFEEVPDSLPAIQYELLEGGIGYLVVPTFASGSLEAAQQFAGQLQEAIRVLDANRPCGWVLDVRYNEGGNGFAMLAGVSPLLGDGVYGYYVYTDGNRIEWGSQAGTIYMGGSPVMEFAGTTYELNEPGNPVAVLTNEVTTSAGELVAIAFHGWPQTLSFGQSTLGRTTAPEGFFLEDGAVFAFSVAWFADRNGQVFRDGFTPESRIPAHDDPTLRDRSIPVQAIDWLLSQPACQGH